jgi:SAM-dependent methyltransferase
MSTFDRAAVRYGRVGPPLFEHFGRRLAEVAGVFRGATCLDLASGTGAAIFPAAERAGSSGFLVGADLSQPMLRRSKEEASSRRLPRVHAIQLSADRLALRSGAFDRVLCGFALGSFAEPDRAVSEVRRVLRTRGRFALSVSDLWWFEGDERWSWLERLLLSMGAQIHDEPPRFGDAEQVRDLLEGHGFGDVVVTLEDFLMRFADFDEWWGWGWSHGYRRILDALSEADIARYKSEAATELGQMSAIEGRTEVLIAHGTAIVAG